MTSHVLNPSPQSAHWGYFDGSLTPAITVRPGEVVTLHAPSAGPEDLPSDPSFTVQDDHRALLEQTPRGMGPHIMAGPVAVEGAEPGDTLRVHILDVTLRDDWGFNVIKPLLGTLPADYPAFKRIHIAIDREARTVTLPWGQTLAAKPFFGVMGVAPPRAWGRLTSIVPRAFGGNIDNTELVAGAVVDFPVFETGGLFSVGDGHALQGDGEVCLTAVETSLVGTFRFDVLKGETLRLPRATTPTHVVTMGFDEDLDDAARIALREMIDLIVSRTRLDREDSYRLCSLACDLRVTQLVNQHKGVHAMLARNILEDPAITPTGTPAASDR
jgi:acetamidase/formamidase